MAVADEWRGAVRQGVVPDWVPLDQLLDPQLARRFGWSHEVELEDGTAVHCYRDIRNGRRLHLGEGGRAFYRTHKQRYREVDPRTALILAFVRTSGGMSQVEAAALRLALVKLESVCEPSA